MAVVVKTHETPGEHEICLANGCSCTPKWSHRLCPMARWVFFYECKRTYMGSGLREARRKSDSALVLFEKVKANTESTESTQHPKSALSERMWVQAVVQDHDITWSAPPLPF